MMLFCRSCGAEIEPEDVFCGNCGEKIVQPAEIEKDKQILIMYHLLGVEAAKTHQTLEGVAKNRGIDYGTFIRDFAPLIGCTEDEARDGMRRYYADGQDHIWAVKKLCYHQDLEDIQNFVKTDPIDGVAVTLLAGEHPSEIGFQYKGEKSVGLEVYLVWAKSEEEATEKTMHPEDIMPSFFFCGEEAWSTGTLEEIDESITNIIRSIESSIPTSEFFKKGPLRTDILWTWRIWDLELSQLVNTVYTQPHKWCRCIFKYYLEKKDKVC